MTRFSSIGDDFEDVERFKTLLEDLLRSNILNNAAIDPDAAGIAAGSNVFNAAGFQSMWGGELRSMTGIANGLNSKIDTTAAGIQTALNDLQSQINNSAGSAALAALQTAFNNYMTQQGVRNAMLQAQVTFILEEYVKKPDRHVPPPPPINT